MSEFTRTWKSGSEIEPEDERIPVRQVYTWILTSDNCAVIVSKDGSRWQLPGGKPDAGESLVDTAVREAQEESGIDLSPYKDKLHCFGYYVVNEPNADPTDYLQVRMRVDLPLSNDMLYLDASGEAGVRQAPEELIRHVAAVSMRYLPDFIPWMPEVAEYTHLTGIDIAEQ